MAGTYPPYPYQARLRHAQGNGVVEISFNAQGDATAAKMVESTGSQVLDGSTVNYMLTTWKSSGVVSATFDLPVRYRIAY